MPSPLHMRNWVALFLLVSLSACNGCKDKTLDRSVNLWRKNKSPYGDKVAFDGLSRIFPHATILTRSTKPFITSNPDKKKACIIIGMAAEPSPAALEEMMNFIEAGNHIFLSGRYFNDRLLNKLGLKTDTGRWYSRNMDSLGVTVFNPASNGFQPYSYPGDGIDTWLKNLDTLHTSILGKDDKGHINMIRIAFRSGGSICIQTAPLAFSNFFLLHKQNMHYYEQALSYVPASVDEVIWADNFRFGEQSRSFSAFRYILKGGPLFWAFCLLLLLFALIYIFGSKRRQRPIPVIEPLRNTSLDFVNTIGRLYYQRQDNQNLAMKMTAHFLDHIRTRWHLPTTELNPAFTDRLAYRTGYPREKLAGLIDYMHGLPLKTSVPDEELMDFYHQLEAFYKHA